MTINGPTRLAKLGVLAVSTVMLMSFLVLSQTDDASAYSNPCPHYSIQDVFDDPTGNWDGDLVRNADELYNGLNPCLLDTQNFCGGGGNALCLYPTYTYVHYPTACQTSVNTSPNADYDGDGIANAVEVRNGANPCTHPCPNPTRADLALNPNGSWDSDGISNAIEVSQGTNPCDGYRYNPCPYYTNYQVRSMPGLDWDGDGITNADEIRLGYNPCQVTTVVRTTTVVQQTNRLPHVVNTPRVTYVPPQPPKPVCPRGYPYYHRGNGLCYANPVGHYYGY